MPVSLGSDVATAPVASLGLVGGYLLARESGSRPLGGVVSGLAGAYAVRTWAVRDGALLLSVALFDDSGVVVGDDVGGVTAPPAGVG
nr:hypothetical protein [Actinomycetota bacterium]